MRILCVMQKGNGVGYHRQWLPLMEMADVYVLFADFVNDEVLQRGFDIVLINRHVPGLELDTLLEYRRKYDFRLIVDIDDYWYLDPWHILYHTYPSKKIVQHIEAADMVTCTHGRLWKELIQHNKNVEILPNALPYGRGQFHDEKVASENVAPDRLRVVYAGSVTHEKDIEIIRNPFKKLSSDTYIKDKLHFIICGYSGQEAPAVVVRAWDRMISSYLSGFKLNGYVRGGLDPEQYMAFYCEADICIAPLVESKFNAMKSNLKVLEAAAKKAPIIVSDVHPYKSCPHAIKVSSKPNWYYAIKKLVLDEEYRRDMGEANHAWAIENFHLDKINEKRNHIYQNLTR